MRQHEIDQLRWLDTADAKIMAKRDIIQKRLRFFSTCGYACQIAGVGQLQAEHCYRGIAEEQIGGTGDFLSGEQSRLRHKAYDFAIEYNRYITKYLDDHGRNQCSKSADWDGALDALSKYVWSLPRGEKYFGQVSISGDNTIFHVGLPMSVPAETVLPKLCAILESHGLTSDATLAISNVDRWEEGRKGQEKSFRCKVPTHK